MTDTRPIMTDAEFETAAAYVDPGSWMTGESLIHREAVMSIVGWNFYGHSGHLQLTPAQRTLMMWSDIVGQISNGGISQYHDNFRRDLALGRAAVRALGWSDLTVRFFPALSWLGRPLRDAFDSWFYTEETKAASVRYVHAFIMRHRGELYRPH